jgi:biopolymer transport protein ExbD
MSAWKVRHQGSPESVAGVSPEEIVDGVKDGIWEPTDEVKGPGESDWQALEVHPVFAQAMADYEPPPPHEPEDETRLDMNPLIDVSLVLLIFFILTTTYEELRKEFLLTGSQSTQEKGKGRPEKELAQFAIRVFASMDNDQVVYTVENEVVTASDLEAKLKSTMAKTGHNKVAVEIDSKTPVPWEAFMVIQDAASGAKASEILQIVRPTPKE